MKLLKSIFRPKNELSLPRKRIKPFVERNRKSLSLIESWIDNKAFENSYYQYGVPDYIKPLLNNDIGNEVTYSDFILYMSKYLTATNYLELGVSVGKNFFQISNGLTNARLTGFDIENIHPALKEKYTFISKEIWEEKKGSLRTEPSELSEYSYMTNKISYVAADIWDENSWSRLQGKKYNIIFSDALHNPEALLWEYKMIEKYSLLDNKFLMLWDDLNNGLEKSFYEIAEKLKNKNNLTEGNVRLVKINGWLGKNEIKHDVGIITNLTQL